MFEAFMAEQTFLTEEPVEKDPSNGSVSNEIPECIMQDVSEGVDQSNQEGEQVQPAIQFGSFPPVSVNMVHILPQEFRAGDENQEGQEADPVQISSEDSQASMVQDNFEMVTPMEDEYESEEVVSINLSYPFEYPSDSMTQHVRPLYIKAFFDGIQLNRVLIDNGAAVNLLPKSSLKKLGKKNPRLIPTSTTIAGFAGDKQMAQGILPINLSVGTRDCMTAFFVIDSNAKYNALLGRDWIHTNKCVPSSLHQKIMMALGNGETEEIDADPQPFIACADFAEAKLYIEGVTPLSILMKDDSSAEVTADEEVTHLKHLVQKGADEEVVLRDDNDAWL
ncbi:hypothetical protein HYC85_030340 [Camellia sinensis]|uniref:Peptidase A2 domain-containing protein n=1 Tax=Camellia sinensis TaxID=4442 RepID=A0A7J7G0N5_CAMSI|nr:hypothetical protein HYC85_030340 [Camellia sinensis]